MTAPANRPPEAQLGAELEARSLEIGRNVLETWMCRNPETGGVADARVQRDVLRATSISTQAVAHYLLTGNAQSAEQAHAIAATGKAPLRDTISLTDLTKLYLYWRDITIAAIRETVARLELGPDVEAQAIAVVRVGSDGSIVRMTKQFDRERKRLQCELAEEQARLAHHAFHDSLTGLPNRRLFFDRLAHALDVAARSRLGTALLFIDVDCFKCVNDTQGHHAGDALLISVASRLRQAARSSDTVARLGGDEFTVLCENLADSEADAAELAARIMEAFDAPFALPEGEIHASASIGVAVADRTTDADRLVLQADRAMYIAKRRGGHGFELLSEPAEPAPTK